MLGLVTCEAAAPHDPDLLPLHAALRARIGESAVSVVSWDDPAVDWSSFSGVIVRSAWDYADRLRDFLTWVDHVDGVTTLVNAAQVVRWSTDKRYLAELAAEGIPIAPTTYVTPGDRIPPVEGLHVVKPTVGAGSSGARRCESDEVAAHVELLHAEGRTAMVQPYLDLLDERGETAHCFVVGADGVGFELSHAFRKAAILTTTEVEQEGDLFAKEEITSRVPAADELAVAETTLATDVVSSLGDIMFARVDIAPFRDVHGIESHVVLELELIEPSFYFATAPSSVDLFADRLIAGLGRRGIAGPFQGGI